MGSTATEDVLPEQLPQPRGVCPEIEDQIEESAVHDSSSSGTSLPPTPEGSSQPYSIFTPTHRRILTAILGLASLASTLTANIYMPLLPLLQDHYRASSQAISLTITIYVIVQAVMPLFIAPFTDAHGRRPVSLVTYSIYTCASLGLALNDARASYVGLLCLRAMQALGASACASITYGVIADVCIPAQRGAMVGLAVASSNLGTVAGPVLGGVIAWETGSAAWVFGLLAIFGASSLIIMVLSLPETARRVVGDGAQGKRLNSAGVLSWLLLGPRWGKSAARLRDPESTEDKTPPTAHPGEPQKSPERLSAATTPLGALKIIFAKDTSLILWLAGSPYAIWYCVSAALPGIYASSYGWDELAIGLAYIPGAAAILVGGFFNGRISKWYFTRTAAEAGLPADAYAVEHDFPIEIARSRGLWPGWVLLHGSLIGLGWAVQARAHPAVCLVLQAIAGFAMSFPFFAFNTLLVDVHPGRPSTVAAAASLVRSGMSGIGVAILPALLNALGYGWFFTLLAGVVGALQALGMLALKRWGMTWRQKRRVAESEVGLGL